jgi:hypothetical protein
VWIFNIADAFVQEQTLTNDGTRLLQVRFYPVATTELIRQSNSGGSQAASPFPILPLCSSML